MNIDLAGRHRDSAADGALAGGRAHRPAAPWRWCWRGLRCWSKALTGAHRSAPGSLLSRV